MNQSSNLSFPTFSIIVPYRDRPDHLAKFVPHYTALFPMAEIIVVEQADNRPFNRGWLLNVGFEQAIGNHVIFHDIDMIAASGMQHYIKFPEHPTQLATHAQQFGYRMPFPEYFGGVTSFSVDDFEACNGFSNNFWSWGGEDCEMYDNVKKCGFEILYKTCYHNCLHHEREFKDICLPTDHPNYILWKQGRGSFDGLDSCIFDIVHLKISGNYHHYKVTSSMPDIQL